MFVYSLRCCFSFLDSQYVRSTVQAQTLDPVWNELWHVKNVPTTASLDVLVMDKDDGPKDDVIGRFDTSVNSGAKEVEIEGTITKRVKGTSG
jgi:Ca2+-dependent lipid-binding protein